MTAQATLPGCEPEAERVRAARLAAAPLAPTVPQRPADFGLFGDTDRQSDLVDLARRAAPSAA